MNEIDCLRVTINYILLYPAFMLISPDITFCLTSSLLESRIFLPIEYVRSDTPAVSASFARTLILSFCETAFGKFIESDFLYVLDFLSPSASD